MEPADPIVVLAPGRSFSSVISAMLGQHPQLYAIPETQLFVRATMEEWWNDFGNVIHADGLSRAIAEIVFGDQSMRSVRRARRWLWQRYAHSSTRDVFVELARLVHPLRIVEKTPMVTYRLEHMERANAFFPGAHFLYIPRHPLGYCRSMVEFFRSRGPRNTRQTSRALYNDESIFFAAVDERADPPVFDPQFAWFRRQRDILDFIATLNSNRVLTVRAEDIMQSPAAALPAILQWLGLDHDRSSIEEMLHPERSPFAQLGPPNAPFGGDPKFYDNPALRPIERTDRLDVPLPWRRDGSGFAPDVADLARSLGYR